MSNELSGVDWVYPLSYISENKASRRTGTMGEESAWELIGFDVALTGGLRPAAGFKLVDSIADRDTSWSAINDSIERGDFRTFSVRVDASNDVSGYVYRIKNSSTGNYRVRCLWYYNGAWESGEVLPEATLGTDNPRWSVDVYGRAIYVYMKGVQPKLIQFEVNDAGTSASAGDDTLDFTVVNFDKDEPIITGTDGAETALTADAATATGTAPGGLLFGTVLNYLDEGDEFTYGDYPDHHEFGTPPQRATSGSSAGSTYCRFQDDQTGDTGNRSPQVDDVCGADDSNLVEGETTLVNPEEGAFSANSRPIDIDVRVVYQLLDSRTGRSTAFSESKIVKVNEAYKQQNIDGQTVNTGNLLRSPRVTPGFYKVLMAFEGYVASEWDRIKIYRSIRYEPTGQGSDPITSQFYTVLDDSIENLTVKSSTTQQPAGSGGTEYTRVAGILALSDEALLQQEVLPTRTNGDTQAPRGGAALMYEQAMFVSDITGNTLPGTSVGEIRYSTLLGADPTQFIPVNRFIPSNPRDTVIRWQRVGGNLVGFSRNRQYLARIESSFIKLEGMHEGFGILSDRAVASLTELCFFATPKGLKVIDSTGVLRDDRLLDSLIIDQWANDWDKIALAYDPQMSVLFVFNPDDEHMGLIWFNNQTTSELLDCRFIGIDQGNIPDENDGAVRAQFCKSDGSIYVYDSDRSKTDGNGGTRTCMNDTAGTLNVVFDLAPSSTELRFSDSPTLDSSMIGTYIYVASGTGYGQKALITAIDAPSGEVTVDTDLRPYLTAGDRLVIDPVYCRWVGGSLIKRSAEGTGFGDDLFRVRSIENIAPYWMDVEGPDSETDWATYRAIVYRGNATSPVEATFPQTVDGNEYRAIRDGSPLAYARVQYGVDGTLLFPGIEVLCADFNFTLLSALVTGKMKASKAEGQFL